MPTSPKTDPLKSDKREDSFSVGRAAELLGRTVREVRSAIDDRVLDASKFDEAYVISRDALFEFASRGGLRTSWY